jgi:hypothetical protein
MALQTGKRQLTVNSSSGVIPVSNQTAVKSLLDQLGPTIKEGIKNTAKIQDENFRSNFNIESMKFFGQLAIDHENDPSSFTEASKSYINESVNKSPKHLKQYIEESGETSAYRLGFQIQQNFIAKQKEDILQTVNMEIGQFSQTINSGILNANNEAEEEISNIQMDKLWKESERKLFNLSDVLNLSEQDISATMRSLYMTSETTRAIKVGKMLIENGKPLEALEYVNQWEAGQDQENMYWSGHTDEEVYNQSKVIRTELTQDISLYNSRLAGEVDLQKLVWQEREVDLRNSLLNFTTPINILEESIQYEEFVINSGNSAQKKDEFIKLLKEKQRIQNSAREVAQGNASKNDFKTEDQRNLIEVLTSQITQQPMFDGITYDASVLDQLAIGNVQNMQNLAGANPLNPNEMGYVDDAKKFALATAVINMQHNWGYIDTVTSNYLRNAAVSNNADQMRKGLAIYEMLKGKIALGDDLKEHKIIYDKLARYPHELSTDREEDIQKWITGNSEIFAKHESILQTKFKDDELAKMSMTYLLDSNAVQNALSRASLYGYTTQHILKFFGGDNFPDVDQNQLIELMKDDATWIPFVSKLFNGIDPTAHQAIMETAMKNYPLNAIGDGTQFDETAWNQSLENSMHSLLAEGYGMTTYNGNGFIENKDYARGFIEKMYDAFPVGLPFIDLFGKDSYFTPNNSFVKYPLEKMYSEIDQTKIKIDIKNDYLSYYDQVAAEAKATDNNNLLTETFGTWSDSGNAFTREQFSGVLDVSLKNNQIMFEYIEGTDNSVNLQGEVIPAYNVTLRTLSEDKMLGKGIFGQTIELRDLNNLDKNWRPIENSEIKNPVYDINGKVINWQNMKSKAAFNAIEKFRKLNYSDTPLYYPNTDIEIKAETIEQVISTFERTKMSLLNSIGSKEFENLTGNQGTWDIADMFKAMGIDIFKNNQFKKLYENELKEIELELRLREMD